MPDTKCDHGRSDCPSCRLDMIGLRASLALANRTPQELQRECALLRTAYEEERVRVADARDACSQASQSHWIWGDEPEENDLGTMSNGMLVSITAGRLRALLEAAKKDGHEDYAAGVANGTCDGRVALSKVTPMEAGTNG